MALRPTIVIAFDVDGTLECGNPKGPIKLKTIRALKRAGFIVGIIGAYQKAVAAGLQGGIDVDFLMSGHPYKPKHLTHLKLVYRPALTIYVGDEPADRQAALQTGCAYIKPQDFPNIE